MTPNDILRRLRFALNLPDAEVRRLCASVGLQVDDASLARWFAREDEPQWEMCPDRVLEALLDGYVLDRRGPPAKERPPATAAILDNNMILKKLRIGLSYQEADMLEVLALGGMTLSSSELGALFRAVGHKHHRPAGDQLLRAFLKGLTMKLRGLGGE